ncbi:MAG: hypothetical protein HYX36_10310 [Rhizobiales bacterium]|nr:hypothetical protein [Hyphomicrobiales bacterium]
MTVEKAALDIVIDAVVDQLPADAVADPTPGTRELFLEFLAVSLGNLYAKMPLPSTLYDRTMMKIITSGIDDGEAGKLVTRAEDWMRLEGVVRAAEGQKAYILNRPSMAVLSTATEAGTLGEVLERVARTYAEQKTSPALRRNVRQLGAYFLTRLGRS